MEFELQYDKILTKVREVDPVAYGKTRNFEDGAVTRLSPYISRGVISTRMVMNHVRSLDLPFYKVEKFIQELAWRDYWQQVWIAKGDEINEDLKQTQPDFEHREMPRAIDEASTGITAVDQKIEELKESGYMHNHMRMYVASLTCNVGKSYWKLPAQWMYYHLLDGDWASNALSWQWVAGSNARKKYYANQANINRYFNSDQQDTFLDTSYEAFYDMEVPEVLQETFVPELKTPLPDSNDISIDPAQLTFLYTYYNLDPKWHENEKGNRILILEPSVFEKYPVSQKSIDFVLGLLQNIPEIQLYVGEYADFIAHYQPEKIYFKEHPLNRHFQGIEESRDWMFSVSGYYGSFFAFWKKCKKELKEWPAKG